jgi:VWFA-related protein
MTRGPLRRTPSASLLWVRLFFVSTIGTIAAQAQAMPPNPPPDSGLTISVDVRLMMLHVSVRDRKGDFVSGLTERNFSVYEDGGLQTIRTFQAEDVPVAVGLVIDHSGSMRNKQAAVTAAALAFARASNPGDDIFVTNFNEHVALGLPDTRLFSASPPELEGAILNSLPAGKTALYDAISSALAHIQQSSAGRKVLVVISDGGDNASTHTLEQVMTAIGRSDVVVFTIGLFDPDDPDLNPRVLRKIAEASGGEAFLPQAVTDTTRICQRIARDIRTQYTISYSPSNQAFRGEYRAIQVRVRSDNGAKLQARARAGYIASPAAPSAQGKSQ